MNSIQKNARVAGFLYLLLVPLAFLGIPDADVATTASNIMTSESQFRLSIVTALLTQIVNIFVVLALYRLLKPVNKSMARLMVIFLLTGVPIAMLNELNRFAALLVSKGVGYLAVFTADQLKALAPLLLDLHQYGIAIAGIFWGLAFSHGVSGFQVGLHPQRSGRLVDDRMFWLCDRQFCSVPFTQLRSEYCCLYVLGRNIVPLWLLIKGVNVEQWEKLALEPAS